MPLALFSSPLAPSLRTAPARWPRWKAKSLSGSESVITTVESSVASTVSTLASRGASKPPSPRSWSSVHTTSLAVSGSPSWNVTPSCNGQRVRQPVLGDLQLGETWRDLPVGCRLHEGLVDVAEQQLIERNSGLVDDVEVGRLDDEAGDHRGVGIALGHGGRRCRRRGSGQRQQRCDGYEQVAVGSAGPTHGGERSDSVPTGTGRGSSPSRRHLSPRWRRGRWPARQCRLRQRRWR